MFTTFGIAKRFRRNSQKAREWSQNSFLGHNTMKYTLFLLSFCCAFSVSSLYAATSVDNSILSLETNKDIFNSSDIVGIGAMSKLVPSPIQKLADIARLDENGRPRESGRMGARLVRVMSESSLLDMTSGADDVFAPLDTEIIGADTDANAGTLQEGRMYTPRLEVDFNVFPTYAALPNDWQQKRTVKLNKQIRTRFGNDVQAIYLEKVLYLRGSVASERQRDVLELYVKMEPGVSEVRNELVVK